jgi:hypothetical protein
MKARAAGMTPQSGRCYISSDALDTQAFNATIRAHGSIENDCRWVLDVNDQEDECLIWRAHGPHNMAMPRHIAQNQIKLDVGKGSQQPKRMGWSEDDFRSLFGLTPCSERQPQNPAAGRCNRPDNVRATSGTTKFRGNCCKDHDHETDSANPDTAPDRAPSLARRAGRRLIGLRGAAARRRDGRARHAGLQ